VRAGVRVDLLIVHAPDLTVVRGPFASIIT
jgi:hypothetical protein